MSDLAAINKAMALYKVDHGSWPAAAPNPGSSTWEISTNPGFLSSLNDYTNSTVFKDPGTSAYWYHDFAAGAYGCAASLGPYYVLLVRGMQSQSGGTHLQNACSGETLFSTDTYSGGAYANTKGFYAYYGF